MMFKLQRKRIKYFFLKKTSNFKIFFILIVFFIIFAEFSTVGYNNEQFASVTNGSVDLFYNSENIGKLNTKIQKGTVLTPIEPINIHSPQDWSKYDFITGSGSNNDPYIIENLEIIGNDFIIDTDLPYPKNSIGIFIMDDNASFIIRNCYISHFNYGIKIKTYNGYLYSKTIENNQIEFCGLGIMTVGRNVLISQNSLSECRVMPKNKILIVERGSVLYNEFYGGIGILTRYSSFDDTIVEKNVVDNCDIGIQSKNGSCTYTDNELENCGFIVDKSNPFENIFEGNTVNSRPMGFFVNLNNSPSHPLIIDGNEKAYCQLLIFNCYNVVIKNLVIDNSSLGLLLIRNHNITLSNVIVSNCLQGMYLEYLVQDLNNNVLKDFLYSEEIALRNNKLALQIFAKSLSETTDCSINFSIQEFTENENDVWFDFNYFTNQTYTFPLGVKINVDNYKFQTGYQMEIFYENESFTEFSNSTSRYNYEFGSDLPNYQYNFTLNKEGDYLIRVRRIMKFGDEEIYGDYQHLNITIIDTTKTNFKLNLPSYPFESLFVTILIPIIFVIFQYSRKQMRIKDID
ncbi:hypothetical protein [Candidatus Harpocratesius sp.]